ncbi:hypothetical protein [Porphyrobacter sp. CACIAM 03H1]|uniref:hypothetical protein n=1 Tax=Porphyrobacter sp. CACIAM 03H1 TaxID=2003315 RepID=UPI0012FE710E|nr:hypothetical protein [Porphyrobacter sp. CACIAM 03H1]
MAHEGACLTRRQVVGGAAALAGASMAGAAWAAEPWDAGAVRHILPAASHDRVLLKVSFTKPIEGAADLVIGGRRWPGTATGSERRHWTFRAQGLAPGRVHELRLMQEGRHLCAPWPLATLPAPDSRPGHFRFLSFTCAGGDPASNTPQLEIFRPTEVRRRLLARALSFGPQAVIANGDHIYWDQTTWLQSRNPRIAKLARARYEAFGMFDRARPVMGTPNEALIERIGDAQIAALYGTSLRSVPSFFVGDDHDYFENDEAEERFVTFPPDAFSMAAKRATQQLFYPEFLPDAARPLALPGSRADGLSESFGTLRVGRLFEALIYDCGGHLSLAGDDARLVPAAAEEWLLKRTRAEDTAQLLHVPSHPPGWSAGKWREWYPDVVAAEASRLTAGGAAVTDFGGASDGAGRLTTAVPKFMWQPGWQAQHQRLMAALAGQRRRPAAVISGDLHATGALKLTRSGTLDLSHNPVHVLLAGPLGTSTAGWPSAVRGGVPQVPGALAAETLDPVRERNGFTIVDVTPESMVFRLFGWREPDPLEAIDTLEPYATIAVARG